MKLKLNSAQLKLELGLSLAIIPNIVDTLFRSNAQGQRTHSAWTKIVESSSEKLLGSVLNNKLTWQNHLNGDKDNMVLVPQLSKRLGMLKRLSKYMSKEKLRYFSSGIFFSKLNYCLPVFGRIFGLDKYKEENRRYFSFTVKDNHNLQVLQNKLNKLLLNAE